MQLIQVCEAAAESRAFQDCHRRTAAVGGVLLVLALAACASSVHSAHGPSPGAATPNHRAPRAIEDAASPPFVPDNGDIAATTTDEPAEIEDEPQLEHEDVHGEGITIAVSWWTQTGTTHVADEVVITTSRGTVQLKNADDEDGEVIPLFEQIYTVSPHRWLVLGWSSFGEGMQTEHAWLIDDTSKPVVVDKLGWTTDRSHAGIALDMRDKLLVGIPLPLSSSSDSGEDEPSLHNESDWQLAHGEQTFTLPEVVEMPASERSLMAVRAYSPPLQPSASERGWNGRFVWFAVGRRFTRQ